MYGDGTVSWNAKRGQWIGRYERHDGSARRKRGWVSAATEAECRRKLHRAKSISATLPAYDGRLRLDTFLRRWLDEMGPTVRPRTADNYRSQVETHIIPALGGHKLTALRPAHVAAYRDAKLADGLSPRTVSHHLTTLRAALTQGVRGGMLERNVASLVPGPHVPDGDSRILTRDEVRTLLHHVEEDEWEGIYLLAALLGMRQGEILGLRWSDVVGGPEDEGATSRVRRGEAVSGGTASAVDGAKVGGGVRERHPGPAALGGPVTVRVTKSLTWLNGRATLEDPKTPRSRRTLTLPTRVAEAIERRRGLPTHFDLVFTDAEGYAIERTAVTRAFQRHLAAAGLPKASFHSLRHSAASSMLDLGLTMREVADILGHSKPSMTADVYTHLGSSAAEKAARLLDGLRDG